MTKCNGIEICSVWSLKKMSANMWYTKKGRKQAGLRQLICDLVVID